MDLTAIFGTNCNKFTEITPSEPNNLICGEQLVRKKSGVKTDALSAVKLDPAVLEAQVTIESTNNTTNCEHDETINEEAAKKESPAVSLDFEETLNSMHRNALLNLTSQQFALLMIYVNNLRKQRVSFRKQTECAFCKNSGQSAAWYMSHSLRDRKGRVRCPMLRALTCPLCGDTGDRAHTLKYCPNNNHWRFL